jgi:hypothetical protein
VADERDRDILRLDVLGPLTRIRRPLRLLRRADECARGAVESVMPVLLLLACENCGFFREHRDE